MAIEIDNVLQAMAAVVGTTTSGAVLLPNGGFNGGGNQLGSVFVANVTRTSGTTLVFRTATPHGIPPSGGAVYVTGVLGILDSVDFIGPNGRVFTGTHLTVLSATTFQVSISGTSFKGTYLGGGSVAVFGGSQIISVGTISTTTAGTPVSVTTSATLATLGLATGSVVGIQNTGDPALDGNYFQITATGASSFTLNRSSSGVNTATGAVSNFTPQGLGVIQNITPSSGNVPVIVTDTGNPTRKSGDSVRLAQVTGFTQSNGSSLNGAFIVDVINQTQFSLRNVTAQGVYVSGGVVNGSYGAQIVSAASGVLVFDLPLDEPIGSNAIQGGSSFVMSAQQDNAIGLPIQPWIVSTRTNSIGQSVLRMEFGQSGPSACSVLVFRNPNAVGLGS